MQTSHDRYLCEPDYETMTVKQLMLLVYRLLKIIKKKLLPKKDGKIDTKQLESFL